MKGIGRGRQNKGIKVQFHDCYQREVLLAS